MARISDDVKQAMGFWYNLISDMARAGNTVTEVIQDANFIAQDLGSSLKPSENRAISQLYGYVRREINAGSALQSASLSQGITDDMISTPPYARVEQEQNTYPLYHVKFEYRALDAAGNEIVETKTSAIPDRLASTVGGLLADVLDDAEGMAKKYGHQLLGVRLLNILAI